MLPANEGFESKNLPVSQRYDGLIESPKFLVLNRSPQVRFQLHSCNHLVSHRRVEDLVARLALGLRPIHGGVCIAQDVGGVFVTRRADRNADARGHEDLVSTEIAWAHHFFDQTLSDQRGVADSANVFQENREFVTPQPGQEVLVFVSGYGIGSAQAPLKPAANLHQELVADHVPETVVDHFEAIQIQEEKSKEVRSFSFWRA